MSSLRQPVGPRSPATYWRRRVTVLVVVLALVYLPVRACTGSDPDDAGKKNQARPAPAVGATPSPGATPGPDVTPIQEPGGSASGTASGVAQPGSGGSDGGSGGGQDGGTGQDGSDDAVVGAGRGLVAAEPNGPPARQGHDGGPLDCPASAFQLVTRTDQRTYAAAATPRFALTIKNTGTRSCRIDVGKNSVELLVMSGPDRVWSSTDCARRQGENLQLLKPGQSVLLMQIGWQRTRSMRGCPSGLPTAKPGTYILTGSVRGLSSTKDVFDLR